MELEKVVSGGQTGVDRAALDAALDAGLPVGGWCPPGRRAEDGEIPDRYLLRETPTEDYAERTAWNVRDSDGTLIIALEELSGGTALTQEEAERRGRPWLRVDPAAADAVSAVRTWIDEEDIRVLNVAGPRASEGDRVYQHARSILDRLFSHLGSN